MAEKMHEQPSSRNAFLGHFASFPFLPGSNGSISICVICHVTEINRSHSNFLEDITLFWLADPFYHTTTPATKIGIDLHFELGDKDDSYFGLRFLARFNLRAVLIQSAVWLLLVVAIALSRSQFAFEPVRMISFVFGKYESFTIAILEQSQIHDLSTVYQFHSRLMDTNDFVWG